MFFVDSVLVSFFLVFVMHRADSSATLLATGEIMTVGGCDGSVTASADLYNPTTDTWRSFPLVRSLCVSPLPFSRFFFPFYRAQCSGLWSWQGARRATPSAILLPDGTVLIINGEDTHIDQVTAVL